MSMQIETMGQQDCYDLGFKTVDIESFDQEHVINWDFAV